MRTGWQVAGAVVMAAACSSPVAPVIDPPPTTVLGAGIYILTLEPGAPAGTPNFCGTVGSQAPNTSVAFRVVLTPAASGWILRPEGDADRGLVGELASTGSGFAGTASGTAFDGNKMVTFGGAGATGEVVQLEGTPVSGQMVSGHTSGRVEFSSSGGTSFCTTFVWVLRRP